MRAVAAILLLFQVAPSFGDSPVIPHLETRLSPISRGLVEFSDEERAKILAYGPWPPAPRRDPSNGVSGKPEAIALGERLFFEPRLSGTGSVLCASCHVPYRAFQDGRPRALGVAETERNTPTLLDVAFYPRFGWEGARDTLSSQSIRPLLEPLEMRSSASHVGTFIRTHAARDYEKAFGRPPPADDGQALLDVGRALAAYQETLVSGRTPFDGFRDALARDDAAGMRGYPLAAQRGLRVFIGTCAGCHAGPAFTNGSVVRGFRVPGLRGVALTAPYMHNGDIGSLRDAVKHYRLGFSPGTIDDLVAFLESLTEQ